jgi:hypothetical protein
VQQQAFLVAWRQMRLRTDDKMTDWLEELDRLESHPNACMCGLPGCQDCIDDCNFELGLRRHARELIDAAKMLTPSGLAKPVAYLFVSREKVRDENKKLREAVKRLEQETQKAFQMHADEECENENLRALLKRVSTKFLYHGEGGNIVCPECEHAGCPPDCELWNAIK